MPSHSKASRSGPQGPLLSILEGSKREVQIIPPVFGAQASWLCFGSDLAGRLHHAAERGDNSLDVLSICEISYLYRLWRTSGSCGGILTLVCPALGIDQSGDLVSLLSVLDASAREDAKRRMGKEYSRGNPRMQGTGDAVQTTAWQGENRPIIINSCSAD